MISNERRNVMALGDIQISLSVDEASSEVSFVIGLVIRFHEQNCMFCSPDVNCLLGSFQASAFYSTNGNVMNMARI